MIVAITRLPRFIRRHLGAFYEDYETSGVSKNLGSLSVDGDAGSIVIKHDPGDVLVTGKTHLLLGGSLRCACDDSGGKDPARSLLQEWRCSSSVNPNEVRDPWNADLFLVMAYRQKPEVLVGRSSF